MNPFQIPSVSLDGSTSITYSHDKAGRVIAAHCTESRNKVSRFVRAKRIENNRRLESLFNPIAA